MAIPTQMLAKKPDEENEVPLPLLALLTFSPVGNPVAGMNAVQRQQFFDSILRGMDEQRAVQILRAKQLIGSALPAAAVLHRIGQSSQEQAKRREEEQAQKAAVLQSENMPISAQAKNLEAKEREKIPAGLPSYRKISKPESGLQEDGSGGETGASHFGVRLSRKQPELSAEGPALLAKEREAGSGGETGASHFGVRLSRKQPELSAAASAQLARAQEELSFVLNDYARGDAAKAQAAASEFSSRLKAEDFKSSDLMAVLLLVIEDQIWAGEEGAAGPARHFGGHLLQSGRVTVPEKLREAAKESAVVRLASVREMLRYYFESHPKDYAAALAMALGLTSDQGEDAELLQERLAYELAHIGGFALAQKILAALKRKKKMEKDTEKCLLELGYKYDKKTRKLFVGKRTCGRPGEARGIAEFLLSLARK